MCDINHFPSAPSVVATVRGHSDDLVVVELGRTLLEIPTYGCRTVAVCFSEGTILTAALKPEGWQLRQVAAGSARVVIEPEPYREEGDSSQFARLEGDLRWVAGGEVHAAC